MKSDIEIKDDLYLLIKGSVLAKAVTGVVKKTGKRPKGSAKEDIVISILDNQNGQLQPAIVNVNIYVKDDIRDNQAEESSIRCRELCQLAEDLFDNIRSKDFQVILDKQRVLEVDGVDEHIINNRLLYKIINE